MRDYSTILIATSSIATRHVWTIEPSYGGGFLLTVDNPENPIRYIAARSIRLQTRDAAVDEMLWFIGWDDGNGKLPAGQ